MARYRLIPGTWRIAFVIAALLFGHAHARAQGAGAASPPVPEAAGVCLSCHGAFGRPDNVEYPIIGGQNAAYLALALRAYRARQRTGELAETMAGFVRELDDPTIDQLAAFFAALRSLR